MWKMQEQFSASARDGAYVENAGAIFRQQVEERIRIALAGMHSDLSLLLRARVGFSMHRGWFLGDGWLFRNSTLSPEPALF